MRTKASENLQTQVTRREEHRPTVRPLVDVFENETEVLLVADLPGVPTENLSVRLEDGELTLEGHWREAPEDEEGEPLRTLSREYRPVDYRRTFLIPEGIEATGVKARVKDGVVRVHLPRAEAFRPREIPISAA